MAINPHHSVEEINGTRCSVIEKNVTPARCTFIKGVLESSGYQVETSESESGLTVGVTDITFNLLYALYGRFLKSANGKLVTPALWNEKEQKESFYWTYEK